MKKPRNLLMLSALLLFAASLAGAKTQVGQNLGLTVGYQVDPDLFVGLRAEGYLGKHLEQIDQVQAEFDDASVSGTELALTGRLLLGRVGRAAVTGIGDLAMYRRGISDSSLWDTVKTPSSFAQYLPRAGVNIHVPVAGGFAVEMNNLFERRLITKPGTYTFWVWRPQMRVVGPGLGGWKAAPYLDYEGYDHKDLKYMGSFSYGLKSRPAAALHLELSDRIFWKPEEKSSTVHVLTLRAEYAFGAEGKE